MPLCSSGCGCVEGGQAVRGREIGSLGEEPGCLKLVMFMPSLPLLSTRLTLPLLLPKMLLPRMPLPLLLLLLLPPPARCV